LPLDQERLADMEVWMAFRYDIHEYGQSTLDDGIDQLCNSVLTLLKNEHLLKDNLNIHLNSMKLHALIDGLAFHKLLNPNGISNDDIQTIVDEGRVRLTLSKRTPHVFYRVGYSVLSNRLLGCNITWFDN